MKALVIADIQIDFLPGGKLPVNNGNEIIPVVNQLQLSKRFDLIVATQDWHPHNHGSFASNYLGKNAFDHILLGGFDQVLWPNHCVQGSIGAEFPSDLNGNNIEAIFRKGMDKNIDSYSGFFDNGKKKDTGLAAYLKGRNIDEVFICGLTADYCVFFTAMDAVDCGFKTTLIEDATRPIDRANFIKKLKLLKEKNVSVINSNIL